MESLHLKPNQAFNEFEKLEFDPTSLQDEPQLDKVTESSDFTTGLGQETHNAGAFRQAAEQGQNTAFTFMAKHANPHQVRGMIGNAFSYFTTGALNQNCIICAKAVEKNIESLEQGRFDTFWVADSTQQGYLLKVGVAQHIECSVAPGERLSERLLDQSTPGSRSIIEVPAKGSSVGHAMNLVRSGTGAVVIDGQFGKIYDLTTEKGQAAFDQHYGANTGMARPVHIYPTGPAPRAPEIDEEWELIQPRRSTDEMDEQQEGGKVNPSAKPTTQLSSKEIIDNYF